MATQIKVSSLPEVTSSTDTDVLVIDDGDVTSKIQKANLFSEIQSEVNSKVKNVIVNGESVVTDHVASFSCIQADDSGIETTIPYNADTLQGYPAKYFNDALDSKVDKVDGKALSSNDFTDALKTKLAGIQEGANKITIDSAFSTTSANPLQNKIITKELDNKVDKVTNSSLMSSDEHTKLAGISTGANKVAASEINGNIKIDDSEITVYSEPINTVHDIDYVHTDNNFTTPEKTKLNGITAEATKVEKSTTNGNIKINGSETVVYTEPTNIVHDSSYKHITVTNTSVSDGTNTFNKYVLPSAVVQDSSYVHTDNNYTSSEKTKLAGIEAKANKSATEVTLENVTPLVITQEQLDLLLENTSNYINIDNNNYYFIKYGYDGQGNLTALYYSTVLLHQSDGTNSYESYEELTVLKNTLNVTKTTYQLKVDSVLSSTSTNSLQNKTIYTELGKKVDKVTGKQLSTNDYTDTEKNKLSGITANANKVEASSTNGHIKIDGVETVVYTEVANTVHDANYVHTDNNFTDSLKNQINTNKENITKKQDTLVSGTNIKTINGSSVLGSGNLIFLTTSDEALN